MRASSEIESLRAKGRNLPARDRIAWREPALTYSRALTQTSMGRLDRDAIWSDEVLVTGDVLVPAGRTLRIAAGTKVRFAARPRWACSVFWRSQTSDSIEATLRELCDLVVLGRLEVMGTAAAPVLLGADSPPWGGITCLESGEVQLQHAILSGTTRFAVQAMDDATVVGLDSRCSGSEFGVWAWGTSRITWTRGSLHGSRASVICCEGSHAHLVQTEDASNEGVATMDWALARVDEGSFVSPRKHCVVARHRSWVKLRGCRGVAAEPVAIVCLDDAHVEST
jgi:hypothetical protein